MAFQVTFDDSRLMSGLSVIQARLSNMREVMNEIGEELLISTRARASQEVAPDGTKWAPLSPRYARWKAKHSGRSKILQLRGYMLGQNLSQQHTDTTVTVGSTAKYALIHQYGGRVTIPARAGSARLRIDRKGDLLRQVDAEGKPIGNGKLAVFAKRSDKQAAVRAYVRGSYSVDIPARPYLGMSEADYATAAEIIGDYLIGG